MTGTAAAKKKVRRELRTVKGCRFGQDCEFLHLDLHAIRMLPKTKGRDDQLDYLRHPVYVENWLKKQEE